MCKFQKWTNFLKFTPLGKSCLDTWNWNEEVVLGVQLKFAKFFLSHTKSCVRSRVKFFFSTKVMLASTTFASFFFFFASRSRAC